MEETRLRFLSFNIEQGVGSSRALDYITRSWQHFLPSAKRLGRLNNISDVVSDYDVVALQEVDSGSIRSSHINQVKYLAERADFPYWYSQLNRNLGKLAQHSNGVLSRVNPHFIDDHKLPGLIPGRGAIVMQLGEGENAVGVVMVHLALGKQARARQIHYIAEQVSHYKHIVIMGDMNCTHQSLKCLKPLQRLGVSPVAKGLGTYPSWRPKVDIDQILISDQIKPINVQVLDDKHSDHLAIAADLVLPTKIIK